MCRKDDALSRERAVLVRGTPNGKIAPPGHEYCWECGHVAPAEDFMDQNRCPSPKCPHPSNWDD